MAQYILIAEIIIKNLEDKQQLNDNIFETIRPIILELKRQLHNSQLIFNRELVQKFISNSNSIFQGGLVDFSLVPKISNKGEFTLWLAGFIQKITINKMKEKHIPLMVVPKVTQVPKQEKRPSNQIEYPHSFNVNDNFCDAINDYFTQIEKID